VARPRSVMDPEGVSCPWRGPGEGGRGEGTATGGRADGEGVGMGVASGLPGKVWWVGQREPGG
jgi:hypothetical protein